MPLFTDSDHITQTDLASIDAEVPAVASAQKITLDGDMGILRMNWGECAQQLNRAIVRASGALGVDPVMAFHLRLQRSIQVQQITLAPQFANSMSPWRRWLIYEALRRFFRAATQRNVGNDRFQLKFEQYGENADQAYRQAASFGVPVVFAPLSAPGAVHDLAAGVWSADNLTKITQSATSDRTLYIAITWVDESQSVNNESAPSQVLAVQLAAAEGVQISIASLTPPGTTTHPNARSGLYYVTGKATGWNVYAGLSSTSLRKQNASLIPLSTSAYSLTGSLASGSLLGDGQTYNTLEPLPNIIYRA